MFGNAQFQKMAMGPALPEPEMTKFLSDMAKRNPNLDIRTIRGVDYAGKFEKGVIYITLGKANKGTFFHENSHALESMIYETGNKELIKIWERGEKLFKNDAKAAGDSIKEFIPDQLQAWAEGRSRNKTIASKMRSWTNMMWSKIKTMSEDY